MFRNVKPGAESRLTLVDHEETFGRHILEKILQNLKPRLCLDLGCGHGDDLSLVKKAAPQCRCVGLDFAIRSRENLQARQIEPMEVDIERERLPFPDESADLIIANQVLEHTKDVYWIHHEVFRVLKSGGHFYLGVPNLLSLHNRLLMPLGIHPTTTKMISAHLRPFSKKDTLLFYQQIGGDFLHLKGFYGAQFYPFPRKPARLLATLFPALAFSIFFLWEKSGPYQGEFLRWLDKTALETSFYQG